MKLETRELILLVVFVTLGFSVLVFGLICLDLRCEEDRVEWQNADIAEIVDFLSLGNRNLTLDEIATILQEIEETEELQERKRDYSNPLGLRNPYENILEIDLRELYNAFLRGDELYLS